MFERGVPIIFFSSNFYVRLYIFSFGFVVINSVLSLSGAYGTDRLSHSQIALEFWAGTWKTHSNFNAR